MIVGIGIDVVDVDRFGDTVRRTPRMRERVFTATERQRPLASLAARFAAKEALAKALGAPAGMHWQDTEIRTDDTGRPWIEMTGTVRARADALGVRSAHLSLSHDAGIASAIVVLEN